MSCSTTLKSHSRSLRIVGIMLKTLGSLCLKYPLDKRSGPGRVENLHCVEIADVSDDVIAASRMRCLPDHRSVRSVYCRSSKMM